MEDELEPEAEERWRRISKRLFTLPPARADFTSRVMARIAAEHPRSSSLERLMDWLQPAPVFGLALAAAALIILLAGGGETVEAGDLLFPDDLLAFALENP